MEINGKTAIITGGASGLGEATTRHFHGLGAKVSIFDMNAEQGAAMAAELGAGARFFQVDVSDGDAVQAAVDASETDQGIPQILCNFAGIAWPSKTFGRKGPMDMDVFRKVIDINLTGTMLMCRAVAASMAKGDPIDGDGQRGVLINTSSIAGEEGQVGQVPYAASKAAIRGMALPMARDLAGIGVRVNTIVPGLIHTPLFDSLPEEAYHSLVGQTMYPQRLGKPNEIARLAQFFVENDYVNAEAIRVDSGMRMQAR